MKKILLNGLLLISGFVGTHTVFCMEDSGHFSESFDIKELLAPSGLDTNDINSYLIYLSYYATALLKQDEIVNKMRSFIALKKLEDSLTAKIKKTDYMSESVIWHEYETFMLFMKYPFLYKITFTKKLSDFEINQIKLAKPVMENSDSAEIRDLNLYYERAVIRSQLADKFETFTQFIKAFHIVCSLEDVRIPVYSNLSMENFNCVQELGNNDLDRIKHASYSEIIRSLRVSDENNLRFGRYAHLLTFYHDLPLAGQNNLKIFQYFNKFIDEKLISSSAEKLQKKLDFYDKNRLHYIQVYQEILQFLKQKVDENFSMKAVLNFQESLSKGQQEPTVIRMPDTFAEVQLDGEVILEDKSDFLPNSLKKTMKKRPKAKGRGKSQAKAKGKPKAQQKRKVQDWQPLKIEEIKKDTVSDIAPDGSFVLEDNDDYIVVSDPKNNLKVRILKSDRKSSVSLSSKQLNALVMTNWVKQWYENSNEALKEQGYMDFKSPKYTSSDLYQQTITYHTPAMILLKHLKNLAQQRMIASRKVPDKQDILFTMPVINFYDNNKQVQPGKNWQSGVAAWILDSEDNKTIYHAEFRPTDVSKMIQDFMQEGYLQISFPTLSEVQEYNQQ